MTVSSSQTRSGRCTGWPALLILLLTSLPGTAAANPEWSVARHWNEALLEAIRNDFARPPVHARNLFHVAAALWDAWAAFDPGADAIFHHESVAADQPQAAREAAMSHAAYRLLRHRFATSPGNDPEHPDDPANTLVRLRALMLELGHDPDYGDADADTPEALGLRIANTIIQYGLSDGSNEANGHANSQYLPINPELQLDLPGNPDMLDINRWQPLQRDDGFVDQSGNQVGAAQVFIGPEWGRVRPFSLTASDQSLYLPDWGGDAIPVYLNVGPPPEFNAAGDAVARTDLIEVIELSSRLDPTQSSLIDISPASQGNNSAGANDGNGYESNPETGAPYTQHWVPEADYLRVIAEYWADGPASETPPGHWFVLLNELGDHPGLEHRIGGQGPVLDRLEWDVKAYLAMGGAMHDAAISAWSHKGYYDSSRPVSAIRRLAEWGQSSDPAQAAWHPWGLPLIDGLIELITEQSIGQHHAHLAEHIGEVAIRSWRGHGHDPEFEIAGVGWIRALEWWPYQQPDFVTPAFAGYLSGHSTFSRTGADILSRLTGNAFFPGGLAEKCFEPGYLTFESGPSQTVCLQWARYFDAADQSARSRLAGGIHPAYDDLPGRLVGQAVAERAWSAAQRHFAGHVRPIFRDAFQE